MPEVTCRKCGASLHPEQKMCMACGAPTDRMPGVITDEPIRRLPDLPWKKIACIGGGVVALIILISVLMSLRVTLPDTVARQWLDAVTCRRYDAAQRFTTQQFEKTGYDEPMSARKGDEYYVFIYNNEAEYTVSRPQFNSARPPTEATVTATFAGKNGQQLIQTIVLVREKSGWKINMCP